MTFPKPPSLNLFRRRNPNFVVDQDFDPCTVGSLKRSSCVGERMRTSLNQLLNQFYQFKVKLFVHDARRRLERFSFECRKVIGFAFTILHDWLKKFAPIFHPIRSKTKTNRDSLTRVFPRFASATCNYFEFRLVHCIVCVLCDWLE